ncbi:hypothetical protein DYI95_003825 [Thermaerobacter sp. PB12/4term]|uniref:hypothetical protein n=1 Tax=Thermaerobacter sp. PB12/4term TaxID=2293838 RepID=UPI000E32758D|nr:hypothetical protein [Thermaerobacter sp. PB12/4term]QIA26763.1 hypothetical protein DYI95_003825 [Thermaerobacter sp. PB12/4term]
MIPEHPNPAPEADEPALAATRAALADRRQEIRPPGGFDAWLHLLAAPVPLPPGAGGAREGAVRVATASLTAPNDPEDPLPLFFIAPARVEAILRRWLEELAAEGGGAGHGEGKPADDRGVVGGRPPAGQPAPAVGTAPAVGPAPEGPLQPAVGGPRGWLLQVGASGMQLRAFAEPPAGFIPRYRLPHRDGQEPVWAPGEPLWCPQPQLAAAPGEVARRLVEALVAQLG